MQRWRSKGEVKCVGRGGAKKSSKFHACVSKIKTCHTHAYNDSAERVKTLAGWRQGGGRAVERVLRTYSKEII